MKRRGFLWYLMLLVFPSLLAGCSALKPKTDESPDAPARKRSSFFFNEKSREIEESLGL